MSRYKVTEFQSLKSNQILCAHKPYFLIPGRIYSNWSYITVIYCIHTNFCGMQFLWYLWSAGYLWNSGEARGQLGRARASPTFKQPTIWTWLCRCRLLWNFIGKNLTYIKWRVGLCNNCETVIIIPSWPHDNCTVKNFNAINLILSSEL